MIETNQSLENLDAIASVAGVDVLLIGPSDLSIELGVPLDYQCDIYQRALDKIAATAAKHGIAAGMYFIRPEMAFPRNVYQSDAPCGIAMEGSSPFHGPTAVSALGHC